MSAEVIDLKHIRTKRNLQKPSLSMSLRKVARDFREEILRAASYNVLWRNDLSVQQYTDLLYIHLLFRQTIEQLFDSLGGRSRVVNVFTGEEKIFELKDYLDQRSVRSLLIQQDLDDLQQLYSVETDSTAKAQEILNYMKRVKKMYSVALLGILYMLEETMVSVGPQLALTLDKRLKLQGKATQYLQGTENQKAQLWELRKSLDSIADFQTQLNILTASTITYRMYRELLEPYFKKRGSIVYLFQ